VSDLNSDWTVKEACLIPHYVQKNGSGTLREWSNLFECINFGERDSRRKSQL